MFKMYKSVRYKQGDYINSHFVLRFEKDRNFFLRIEVPLWIVFTKKVDNIRVF